MSLVQRPISWPNTTHTFCAVVKATDADGQPTTYETMVYSSLPADLGNWIYQRLPEPGRNYGLDETIPWALKNFNADVFAWKPLRITSPFYELAHERVDFLNGGRLQYTPVDKLLWRPKKVSNCIRAVSDTFAPEFPKLLTQKMRRGPLSLVAAIGFHHPIRGEIALFSWVFAHRPPVLSVAGLSNK